MRPKLHIIRGVPGSGKSTIARQMLGYVHLENDMFLMEDGVYKWSRKAIKEARRKCIAATRDALLAGNDVVVSNCFLTQKSMAPYLYIAKEASADVSVEVATGMFQNIHGVPETVVISMRETFED